MMFVAFGNFHDHHYNKYSMSDQILVKNMYLAPTQKVHDRVVDIYVQVPGSSFIAVSRLLAFENQNICRYRQVCPVEIRDEASTCQKIFSLKYSLRANNCLHT